MITPPPTTGPTTPSLDPRSGRAAAAPDPDEILAALRPRLRRARVAHLRRLGAGLVLVPLMGVGAALAATASAPTSVETAGPDVGETAAPGVAELLSRGDRAPVDPDGARGPAEPPDAVASPGSVDPAPGGAPDDASVVVELGEFGSARVAFGPADVTGAPEPAELVALELADGWELVASAGEPGRLRLVVSDTETTWVVVVERGLWDEPVVSVDELVVPLPPEPEPEPAPPTPNPAPEPVVDRVVISTDGGTVVVEREGSVLFAGALEPAAGVRGDIVIGEGPEVKVLFTDGTTRWWARAWIDEAGVLRTDTARETVEPPAEPVLVRAEIPGVAAVHLKALDGIVWIVEVAPQPGYEPWITRDGDTSVRIEFEGNGELWVLEGAVGPDGVPVYDYVRVA